MMYPCPLCQNPQPIRVNRKEKPYFRCDDCGVLMFVNAPKGIDRLRIKHTPARAIVQDSLGSLFG